MGGGRTKKAEQVFATIDIRKRLASQVRSRVFHFGSNVIQLFTLEPVQENPPQRPVEVLLQTLDNFLKDVVLHTGEFSLLFLSFQVLVKNHTSRLLRRQLHDLEIFGNVLPIVDQEAFQPVWHRDPYSTAGLEDLLLERHQ